MQSLDSLKELYDRFKHEVAKYAGMNKLPNEREQKFLHRQAQKNSWHFFAKKQITDLRDKITAQVNLLQPALTAEVNIHRACRSDQGLHFAPSLLLLLVHVSLETDR